MRKIFIYSTLSASVDYKTYEKGPEGAPPIETGSIVIQGGAGLADKNFITPRGVVTAITPEQFERLQLNPVYKLHAANGYVMGTETKEEADIVAADMTGRDNSAPLVPQDYEAQGATPPTVGNTEPQGEVKAPATKKR